MAGFWSAVIVTESVLDVIVAAPNVAGPCRRVGHGTGVEVGLGDGVGAGAGDRGSWREVESVQAAFVALSSVMSNGPPRVTLPVLVSV